MRLRRKDKANEYLVGYRERNREKLRAYHAAWSATNKDKVKAAAKKFRDKKKGLI